MAWRSTILQCRQQTNARSTPDSNRSSSACGIEQHTAHTAHGYAVHGGRREMNRGPWPSRPRQTAPIVISRISLNGLPPTWRRPAHGRKGGRRGRRGPDNDNSALLLFASSSASGENGMVLRLVATRLIAAKIPKPLRVREKAWAARIVSHLSDPCPSLANYSWRTAHGASDACHAS
jgi:hypothetical protein